MTLEEIRTLLHFKDAPTENCQEVNSLLDAHIGHVASRMRELKSLQRELRALREHCSSGQAAANCGILGGLDQGARDHHEPDVRNQRQRDHIAGAHLRVGAVSRR